MDVGGTGTKWAVAVNGVLKEAGWAAPLRKHLFLEEEFHSFEAVCREVKEVVPIIDRVKVGITGVLRQSVQQEIAVEVLRRIWGITKHDVIVMSDIELSYLSQFQETEGILISAGTGSIAAYRNRNGELNFVGGKGYLIGDEGSGFWIGSQGIRESIRYFEENRVDEILGREIKEYFKIGDWRELTSIIYSTEGRAQIANTAVVVERAAYAGSTMGISILEMAAKHLARLYEIAKLEAVSDELRVIGGVLGPDSNVRILLGQILSRELNSPLLYPEAFAALNIQG